MTTEICLLRCTIEEGVFSGERIITLDTVEQNKFRAVAPVHYCYTNDGEPLNETSPKHAISGFVEVSVTVDGDKGLIWLPDGQKHMVSFKTLNTLKGETF